MTKRRYHYDTERARENLLRRADTGFDGRLFRVLWYDDPRPLYRYLLSGKPLSAYERKGLVWMLEKKFFEKPRVGRPKGRVRSQFFDAAHRVGKVVHRRREAERAADDRQRLSKGRLVELIAQAIEEDEKRHPRSKGLLTVDYVRSVVTR